MYQHLLKAMNKIKQIIGQWKGLTIGLSMAVLFVGVFALANSYYADTVNVYQSGESEENFSGVVFEEEDFTEGFKVDGKQMYDTYGNKYYNINVNCETDNRATTTADAIDGTGLATMTICYWQNPLVDKDLVIEDLRLDVIETFSFASTLQTGTTTSLSTQAVYPYNVWTAPDGTATLATSTPSVIASTTVSTSFDSAIHGMIGIDTEPGGAIIADADEFVLDGDAFIIVGWTPYAATSTASFDVAGAFTGDVVMTGKAYVRGE